MSTQPYKYRHRHGRGHTAELYTNVMYRVQWGTASLA